MAHLHQLEFVRTVARALRPQYTGVKILEIGSYDVNGGIRAFFADSDYLGADLSEGPGVDVVCSGDKLDFQDGLFDLCLSCECFEHNPQWLQTFVNMIRMTAPGGVVLMTCATTGRLEHGTARTMPSESPGTQSVGWNYYRNLVERNFTSSLPLDELFSSFQFLRNRYSADLYFIGVKTGAAPRFQFDMAALRQQVEATMRRLGPVQPSIPQSAPVRWMVRIGEWPVRAAAVLPEKAFQDFSFHYLALLDRIKAPLKALIGRS